MVWMRLSKRVKYNLFDWRDWRVGKDNHGVRWRRETDWIRIFASSISRLTFSRALLKVPDLLLLFFQGIPSSPHLPTASIKALVSIAQASAFPLNSICNFSLLAPALFDFFSSFSSALCCSRLLCGIFDCFCEVCVFVVWIMTGCLSVLPWNEGWM